MNRLVKLKHLYNLKLLGYEYFEGFNTKEATIKMPKDLEELNKLTQNCH